MVKEVLKALEIQAKELEIRCKQMELKNLENEFKEFDPALNLKMDKDKLFIKKINTLRGVLSDSVSEENEVPGMESNWVPVIKGKEREVVMDKLIDFVLKI